MTEGRGPDPAAVYLRMDDFPARLDHRAGRARPAAGLRLGGGRRATLAEVAHILTAAGVPVKARRRCRAGGPSGRPDAARRGPVRQLAGDLLRGRAGQPACDQPVRQRFVTGDQGLGHVVLPAADDEETLAFYTDLLGFRLRDSMRMPGEFFGSRPAASRCGCVPRLLPAPSLAGAGADGPGRRDRAPDDRGRHPRRRGPGA